MKAGNRAVSRGVVLGVGVCLLTLSALAEDCPEIVGQWSNHPAYDVAASGGFVFFGNGSSVP